MNDRQILAYALIAILGVIGGGLLVALRRRRRRARRSSGRIDVRVKE